MKVGEIFGLLLQVLKSVKFAWFEKREKVQGIEFISVRHVLSSLWQSQFQRKVESVHEADKVKVIDKIEPE